VAGASEVPVVVMCKGPVVASCARRFLTLRSCVSPAHPRRQEKVMFKANAGGGGGGGGVVATTVVRKAVMLAAQ
jgi:hypothetical protein